MEAALLEFGRHCRAGKQSRKSNITNIVPYQTTVVGRDSARGPRGLIAHVNPLQGRYSCAQLTEKKTEAERG